ncbi:hypothetical protein BCR32DRAFT_266375 [Anaeromyces robustus]|uniref:Uncharacterized protein n=1 Tax=Anaeromyces robustus TaxID=1754192 RepID=A0A1Y1XF30_9FUNG|nr:hypothetical protein BCR32DRAFT_266375 [Anaeromyces robustus]|eukprot:ORX84327.1 hypothetical protein BCR32DRAFT_266375 [Anaeromyces robustus]
MAFTFKESSSYLFNKDDQEYIFNKKKLINSSVVQLYINNHYMYVYWKLYNTHLEIQFAPNLTEYAIFKINLPRNMMDNIQFKEDKNGKFIYMFLLSNDGIVFKYNIDIKLKEINMHNQYVIKNDSMFEKKQSINHSLLRNFSKFITNSTEDFIQDVSYINFNNKNYIILLFNNTLYILNENLKSIYTEELMKSTISKSKKYIGIYDSYTEETNEYISFKLCILLGNEFHIFKMIIDQNEYVNLLDDSDVLPAVELIPNDKKKFIYVNSFQISYINNHYILWVEQKDGSNKSTIKYLYLGENNDLDNNINSHCPEIWLPLISNNIIENTDTFGSGNKNKLDSEESFDISSKIKEKVDNTDHEEVFPKSLSTISFSNYSLLSDINDISSMPSYENNMENNENESIELIKEYYLNYIFNINKFSLSILYYSLIRYSEEADISIYVDQLELKHFGLSYIKKCIISCINEKINSNIITSNDKNNVEKEYKKFLYYCIMEYEKENKFISFLQYSQDIVEKTTIPLFILIKSAYITTVNLCDTSEIFYNALTNKHSMMELQYLFSITDLNKKTSYHNVSSSMACFLSAIDQLYRNQSLSEKFNINKPNHTVKSQTLNIQQLTRDIIVGICKSSIQLESLVENIYYDYLADNEYFLKKIRKLKDIKGCIDYVFNILGEQDEQTMPLGNVVRNELYNENSKISKSYITYLAQLVSVNVKEVINARYHLCFHLFIILIAIYIIDKQNSPKKGSTDSQLNRIGLFKPEVGHFEYLNYLNRCKSYLHALIILKWSSEYSDAKDMNINSNNQIMELEMLKNLSISNISKNSSNKKENNIVNNNIIMDTERIKFILSYFKINKINIDDKIDHTVLSHVNNSLLYHLMYSSILSLVNIKGEEIKENKAEEENSLPSTNNSESLNYINYFSLYPSDLARQSISLLDIIYDYSHRYLYSINLSWYTKDYILSSPLISFVIQIIQHSNKAYQHLRELLPSINSSCLFLLQGIISLISNDLESSEEYFEKAGAAFVANTVDSSIYTFLPLTIKNAYQYYQYIMKLYQSIGLLNKQIEKFAKLSLLYMKESDLKKNDKSDDLKLFIFKCLINTLNFEEAYLVINNIMDTERKKQLLEEFIIKICENDQTLLYKYTFSGYQNDIENILLYRTTISTNPLALPNYNKILYSYLIYNNSYRKAASVMYNYSQQLYKCCKANVFNNSFKSFLVEQSKALLITINALSLVDKKSQYITVRREVKDKTIQLVKNVSLLDIRKEYYLSLSKLELSRNHKESESSILSLDPVDAVTLYISLGKYDSALSFSLLYDFDLSIIFQNLLLQYVKSSFMIINSNSNYITDYFDKVLSGKGKRGLIKAKEENDESKGHTPTLNLPKQLFMQSHNSDNITIYNYKNELMEHNKNLQHHLLNDFDRRLSQDNKKASTINISVDFCELLKKYLALHDSPTNYYRYHKVVIEKFLETCITSEVPEWLVQPFVDQFSEDLIRIYIKYNRIKEAALFTIRMLNNIDETNKDKKWFPYSVIDQLLCIMEERSQKDIKDKKIFNTYINSIHNLVQTKCL